MKLYQRNGIYYVSLSRTKRISLHTRNKEEAKRLFRKIKIKYLEGEFNLVSKSRKLKKCIDEYLEYVSKTLEPATLRRYRNTLFIFLEIIANKDIADVTIKDVELFKIERLGKVTKATVNIDLRQLKAFFNKCIEWSYIEKNPTDSIKKLKTVKREKFLDIEDIKKMFEVIDKEVFKVLFACYIFTGRRRSEVLNLKIEDIDIKNNVMYYINSKTKQRSSMPIPEVLQETLYSYILKNLFIIKKNRNKLFKINKDYVSRRFKKYFRMIGKEDFRLHDLRHTFATYLVLNNVNSRIIQELLNHSNIATTEKYMHLNQDVQKKIINKVFNDF